MAVPSSGQLREYADIGVELGVAQSNVSLRGMSAIAGFSTPDAMSEFYGYSSGVCTNNSDPFGDSSGIALYRFNNNVNDSSGNYNATALQSISYTTGKYNQSVFSNNAVPPIITSSIPSTSVQTVSFWLNTSSFYTDEVYISSYAPKRPATGIAGVFVNRGGAQVISLPLIPLNQWNNIVLTVNSGVLYYYLNGAFVNSYSSAINYIYWFDVLTGDTIVPNTHKIDQFRVFNRGLTSTEAISLNNEIIC